MTTIDLNIRGMTCEHCVRSVSRALAALDGVRVERVDIGKATVTYDPARVTPEALRNAVAEEGYEVPDGK